MAEAIRVDDFGTQEMTAPAAVASGEILQLPDGRAGVYPGLNAAASGDTVALATTGNFKVPLTDSIAILAGGRVYWDASAGKAHFKQAGDRDFYLGRAVADVAAGTSQFVTVALNVDPPYHIDMSKDAFDTVVVLTAGTPTLAMQGGAIVSKFSATAEAQKCDALSKDSFAVGANAIIEFQLEVVDNGDASAGDINIGAANGTHASDADSITESVFVHIDSNSLNILAESDDGATEVDATDTTVDYAEGTRFEGWIDMRDPSDCQIYIDGVLVLSGTTFDVSAASGPLKLLFHVEKSADDTLLEVHCDVLRCRLMDAA